MKILIGLLAFVLVLAPFTGEDDPGAANADSTPAAPVPKAPATATVTATPDTKSGEGTDEEPSQAKDGATETTPAEPSKTATRRTQTYLVTRVIDGDTVELGNGESVRVVGIDTPERGECGYAEATANLQRLALGKRVRLGDSDEDRDRYGRLLRYLDIGKVDAGLRQIEAGLAISRYDSRDGYGFHPRENRYIAADKATPAKTCPKPTQSNGGSTSVYYENCTAARDAGAAPVRRGDAGYGSHLDRDGDGVGCE